MSLPSEVDKLGRIAFCVGTPLPAVFADGGSYSGGNACLPVGCRQGLASRFCLRGVGHTRLLEKSIGAVVTSCPVTKGVNGGALQIE